MLFCTFFKTFVIHCIILYIIHILYNIYIYIHNSIMYYLGEIGEFLLKNYIFQYKK